MNNILQGQKPYTFRTEMPLPIIHNLKKPVQDLPQKRQANEENNYICIP